VLAGKARAAHAEDVFDLGWGPAPGEPMPGDPEIDEAPIGWREVLGDAPVANVVPVFDAGLGRVDPSRRVG
jgi:hypothetical protein